MSEGLVIGGARESEQFRSVIVVLRECVGEDYCFTREEQHEYYQLLSIAAIAADNAVEFLNYEDSI